MYVADVQHDRYSSVYPNRSCLVLILHGREDPIPWRYAERIHQALPDSRLELLEEVGHWIFLEGEERFLKLAREFMESDD